MTKPKKIAGVDVLLEVEDHNGNFVVVGGQTGASLSREREEIDTTDKTSNGWSSAIAGLGSWSVEGEGFVQLNDNSFDLIEDTFMKGKEVRINIRMGANSDESGRNYTGYGYILDLPLDFAQDSAVTFSLTIRGNGELKITKGAIGSGNTEQPPAGGGEDESDEGNSQTVWISMWENQGDDGAIDIIAQIFDYNDINQLVVTDPAGNEHFGEDIVRYSVYESGSYTFTATDNSTGRVNTNTLAVTFPN